MNRKPKSAKRGDILTAKRPKWHENVNDESVVTAFKYLSLFMDVELAFDISNRFHDLGNIASIKARELLRAAELPVLERTDVHVMHELVTITNGLKLSPVLCLRGDRRRKPVIVDGYYRICAAYYCDPDIEVPVKIV